MGYIRAGLVAAVAGAVIGAVAGMLYGLYGAPHEWAMMSAVVLLARDGVVAGATLGTTIGVTNRMLHRRAIIQRAIGKLSKMVGYKNVKILVGMIAGLILGAGVGALIEIAIGVEKIRPFPKGMFLDASGAIYITTAIGAIVGVVGGVVDKLPDKTVRRVLGGMISGVVLGIAIGIFLGIVTAVFFLINFNMNDFIPAIVFVIYCTIIVTVPMAIFGVPVAMISEAVVERFLGDIPVAEVPIEQH